MARKPLLPTARRTARTAAAALIAALALPAAASAANPTDAGTLYYSVSGTDGWSIWPSGARKTYQGGYAERVGGFSGSGGKLTRAGASNIWDINADTNSGGGLNPAGISPIFSAYAADGTNLVFTDTSQGLVAIQRAGFARTVLDPNPAGRVSTSSESATGRVVWEGGSPRGIWIRENGANRSLVIGTNVSEPSISQNGAIVAFTVDRGEGDTDLAILDLRVADPEPYLLNGMSAGRDAMPAVSPDGTKVAFASTRDGSESLWITDTLGAGTPVKVPNTNAVAAISGTAWRPQTAVTAGTASLSGTAVQGQVLTASGAGETGSTPIDITYRWERCTTAEVPVCTTLGTTGATYTLQAADVGRTVRATRVAANPVTTVSVVAGETAVVQAPDTTPPAAPAITGKPAAATNATASTFTWTGEAGGRYECAIDAGAYGACTSGKLVTGLADGAHTFRVRQYDAAENQGVAATYTWTIDTVAPAAPSLPGRPASPNRFADASFLVSGEPGGRYECRLDGGQWESCTTTPELPGLADGEHTFTVRQIDAAGNEGAEKPHTWTVDTTAPAAPAITGKPASPTNQTVAAFTVTGEEGGSFACRLDDGQLTECDATPSFTDLAPGVHTFRVVQLDAAGNEGPEATFTWTIDTSVPAAPQLTAAPAALTSKTTATFSFSGVEGATFQCWLDPAVARVSASWKPCASPHVVEGLAAGGHTLRVRQINPAGTPSASVAATWTIDTAGPSAPALTSAPPASTVATNATIVFAGTEKGAAFECAVDGGAFAACVSPLKLSDLAPGPHEVELRQIDHAGNAGEVRTVTWTVVAPPKAEAPKVEAPAPADPPKPAPAAPAKPRTLTAIIGGTPAAGDKGKGTSAAASIEVERQTVGVGCRISGTVLTACKVDLYADVPAGAHTARAAARQVLVGTGRYEDADGSGRLAVKVTLNAVGRELLRRSPDGLQVAVRITGTPKTGARLEASGVAKLVAPKAARAALTVGGFAVDSPVLTAAAKRQLAAVAVRFRGTVTSVRCIGHTDGSSDDADYLDRLGERRAAAVCRYLAARGVRARSVGTVSRGAAQPRATNGTAAGRAQNRRVQLRITR